MAENSATKDKLSLGTKLLAGFLIFFALRQFGALLDFPRYRSLFGDYPPQIIMLRYAFSLGLRLFMLATGIGLFRRKEFFRKMALLFAVFTPLTVYWKHPVAMMRQMTLRWSAEFLSSPAARSSPQQFDVRFLMVAYPEAFAWTFVAVCYLSDILFSVLLLWHLTRPNIRAQFR